jgi:hypothetical protein
LDKTYVVTITYPSGAVATTALTGNNRAIDSSTNTSTSSLMTATNLVDMTLDFGVIMPKVSVGNYVWLDANRDGIQDGNEAGIAGVVLTITKPDGSAVTNVYGDPVTTTTTDANGLYLFTDLQLGQYVVTVTPPAGFIPTLTGAGTNATDSSTTTATSTNLTTNGDSDPTLDFGFVKPKVSVGNYVWLDTNRDGIQDNGEAGIAGVVLTIKKADGSAVTNVYDQPVTTTTTNANGQYVFPDLPLGQYVVTVTPPPGFLPTLAGAGTNAAKDSSTTTAMSINLTTNGDSDPTLDFGFVKPKVSVGNYVWLDTNRDGIQDDDETRIPGVVLTITNTDGSAVTNVYGQSVVTTTTNANGQYVFPDLPLGQYVVAVTPPAGYTPTLAGIGTDATKDSSTSTATSINLTTHEESDTTLDFGFWAPAAVVTEPEPSTTTTTTTTTTLPPEPKQPPKLPVSGSTMLPLFNTAMALFIAGLLLRRKVRY